MHTYSGSNSNELELRGQSQGEPCLSEVSSGQSSMCKTNLASENPVLLDSWALVAVTESEVR